jgi:hypothetical protein
MATCIDKNDQTTGNALALPSAPTVNSRGEYTLAQIDRFAEELAQTIQADRERNPILIATNEYGSEAFYNSYNPLNGFLRNENLSDYSDLSKRLGIGDITALEYADFIKQYNLTPTSFDNKRNNDKTNLLFQLNNYYKSSFSESLLGGFCRLMPQVFGAIDAFFTLIGKIQGFIDDATKYLNKIRNYREELSNLSKKEIVKKLIEKIKEEILNFIDEIFASLTDAVGNFDETQFEQDPPTPAAERIAARARFLKEEAQSFFSEENKEKIKKKFRDLLDYVVSLFENPSLEEIEFAVARFCSFATGIEALIKDVQSPINNFGSKYSTVVNRLKAISHATTAKAIENGAIRKSDEAKSEAINTIEQNIWVYDEEVERIIIPESGVIPPEEVKKDYPTPDGTAPQNTPPVSASEFGELPTFEKVKKGRDARFVFSGNWVTELGEQGWTRVDERAKIALLRLQKEMKVQLTITSAWRSQQYNKKIGGVKNSLHLTGLAFDIANPPGLSPILGTWRTTAGTIRVVKFKELAKRCGFTFVKFYSKHIHLDIGKR